MFGWLMNPWMLGLGALAVASPIIIHLLNKRRFKIVDWAAMDFLFEAEKKNRRRVQVENFILLFLRCLAMLLIGLLLARPFIPNEVARVIQPNQKFERIVLIDDSLSSDVVHAGVPAIERARNSLTRLVTEFADSNRTEDWLTVVLTSDPQQPLLANEPITRETLPTLLEKMDQIETTDRRARYSESLTELKRYFSGQQPNVSRVAYLFSDLREMDWQGDAEPQSDLAPNQLLNELAEDAAECYLIEYRRRERPESGRDQSATAGSAGRQSCRSICGGGEKPGYDDDRQLEAGVSGKRSASAISAGGQPAAGQVTRDRVSIHVSSGSG